MVGVPSCAAVTDERPAARLAPCARDDGPIDAYCGTLTVFEDRAAASGRQIDLWVVVLPSLSATPLEDPVFFLAGGPGQGAAQLAGQIAPLFRRIQRTRD